TVTSLLPISFLHVVSRSYVTRLWISSLPPPPSSKGHTQKTFQDALQDTHLIFETQSAFSFGKPTLRSVRVGELVEAPVKNMRTWRVVSESASWWAPGFLMDPKALKEEPMLRNLTSVIKKQTEEWKSLSGVGARESEREERKKKGVWGRWKDRREREFEEIMREEEGKDLEYVVGDATERITTIAELTYHSTGSWVSLVKGECNELCTHLQNSSLRVNPKTALYSEQHAFDPESWNLPIHGVVSTLDSLPHSNNSYDVVVFDEASFARFHTLSSTLAPRLPKVLARCQQVLQEAKKVLIMQHDLTQDDVDYYLAFEGIDPEDRTMVYYRLLQIPPRLAPIKITTNLALLITRVCRQFLASFVDGVCQEPMLICCTSVKITMLFIQYLKSIAPYPERAHAIWSQVQEENWNASFMSDPNAFSSQADVLVMNH
ncbi:hypothetical protein HDV05_006014, partial [Chytridiales sp. JEL 0842]